MHQNDENKYALVNQDDFFKIFEKDLNLVKNEYHFITKAFYEKDSVVALYDEEGLKDCYFQLPEYRSKLVPHSRRYIYFLPKNTLDNTTKSKSPDGRNNIEIDKLIKVADPYTLEGDKVLENKSTSTEKQEDIYTQLGKLSKLELAMVITKATSELLTKE